MSEQKKRRHWLSWVRDLLLIALLITGIQWWQTKDLAGTTAPALRGPTVTGERLDLADFRGEPVLVHFWAEWCPICRAEDGTIDGLAEDYRVLTVATQSGNAAEVAAYLQQQALDFPVLLDQSGRLAQAWGIPGVPSSFVVDSEGRIASVAVGYTTSLGLRLRLWWAGWSP